MSRPRKWRKVACMPECNRFGPLDATLNNNVCVLMTIDEHETIRLIDLEGLTQEECAVQMAVARTTVQRIYNDARLKLADALVNGKILRIEGGDYKLYDSEELENCNGCRKMRCGHGRNRNL